MSTRTRTWSTAIPVDHTQIKLGPTKIKDVRTDLEERVDGILAGFIDTGTTNGLLLGRLLTVGTANSSNPGTGSAAAIDVYGMTTGTMTELFCRNSSGNAVQLTYQGKLLAGQLLNDKYFIGIGTTNGSVNILKINTVGATQMTNPVVFDTFPLAPNTNPTTALQLSPKGYTDSISDIALNAITTSEATNLIKLISDYGTSGTTGTARAQNVIQVCYGQRTVGASSTATVTGLPFTSSTSYSVVATYEYTTGGLLYNIAVTKDSASQFTLRNGNGASLVLDWIAIGI
jgi:hypothetical protein